VTDESVKDVDLYVARAATSMATRWRPVAIPAPGRRERAMRDKLRTELAATCTRCARRSSSGLRTDQGTAWFSPLQLARPTECSPRVEAGVRVSNLLKLFRAAGFWKWHKQTVKRPVLQERHRKLAISHQQDYCLRVPVRTPAQHTAESPSAKRYADTHLERVELPARGVLPGELFRPSGSGW